MNTSIANVAKLPYVIKAVSPFATANSALVSKDGTIAYSTVSWNMSPIRSTTSYLDQLDQAVAPATKAGLQVEYGAGAGQIGNDQPRPDVRDHRAGLRAVAAAVHVRLRSPR